jgi:hypothetical protein
MGKFEFKTSMLIVITILNTIIIALKELLIKTDLDGTLL